MKVQYNYFMHLNIRFYNDLCHKNILLQNTHNSYKTQSSLVYIMMDKCISGSSISHHISYNVFTCN